MFCRTLAESLSASLRKELGGGIRGSLVKSSNSMDDFWTLLAYREFSAARATLSKVPPAISPIVSSLILVEAQYHAARPHTHSHFALPFSHPDSDLRPSERRLIETLRRFASIRSSLLAVYTTLPDFEQAKYMLESLENAIVEFPLPSAIKPVIEYI